jgi:hypothetical protein
LRKKIARGLGFLEGEEVEEGTYGFFSALSIVHEEDGADCEEGCPG